MTTVQHDLPALDEMLAPLLLMEEGEHELTGAEEGEDVRGYFFPATRHSTYLNHAANGPLPRPVVTTVREYLEDVSAFGGNHEERWREYERGAHRRLAKMIGARADQMAFTASTGDGLMMLALGLSWSAGDVIISAEGEFPANVYPWLNLQEQGVHVHFVPLQENRVDTDAVLQCIREHERTRLVSLSLVEFSTGYRNHIATIARVCAERGIICGVDAMQALGALDIDVEALGVDYLAAASHKWLLAPRTCGILYVADTLLPKLAVRRRGWYSVETPFDFFRHDQQVKAGAARFEHSSSNLMAAVGFDAALGIFECLEGGMQAVEARVLGLTEWAIAGLERLGYPVVSPRGLGECSGIVCFLPHPDRGAMTAQQIADALEARNMFVAARGTIVRISPHFYNTLDEVDTLLNALEDLKRPGPSLP